MSKHDPSCYQFVEHAGMPSDCFCDLIASVRTDERASAYPGREIRSQLLEALQKLDAALAEVEKWRLNTLVAQHERDANSAEIDRMVGELSVIRMEHEADVAALRDARDAARAEVAGLRETVARLRKSAIERRTRMNNLRAKAEGLGHWIDCEAFEDLNEGSDYGNENIRETGEPCSCLIREFLALLDEELES